MGHLLATTDLEKSFRVNMNMIGLDNRPQVKNLLEILNQWLEYRKITLRRRLQTSLDKVLDRLHILEGLLIAFLNIDEVIEIIRNYDDASTELQARFKLTEVQAEAILNIRLRKLAKIEEIEIKKEQKELQKEKDLLEGYLTSDVKFRNLMKKEFKQILKDFGDARRSQVVAVEKTQALDDKDLMPNEKVTVILSKAGWIRCAKSDNIDPKGLSYKADDKPYLVALGNYNVKLVFLSKLGKAYSMYVDKFPSARGYGEHITTYIPLDKADKIIGMHFVNVAEYFLIVSESGKGFVIKAEDLITNKVTGKNIFDTNDVFKILPLNNDYKVIAISSQGRVVARDFNSFALLKKGKGKSIIKLDKKDKLKFVEIFTANQEIVLHAGKRFMHIDANNYYTDKPSGGGVLLPKGFRNITKIDIKSLDKIEDK
ncbi:MAG: hypothetical protein Kow0076_6680 [Francisella sp.]